MPNDDTTKKLTDDNSPILVQEDSLPPTLQDSPLPQTTNQSQQPEPVVETPPLTTDLPTPPSVPTDTGSAAPSDDVVMPPIVTSKQKKKFAGGRVIATILGLFLLVGGLGAGILLVKQDQNIGEKADYAFDVCYDACRAGGKGHQVCTCDCGGACTRPDSGTPPPVGLGEDIYDGYCNSSDLGAGGYVQCGSSADCRFCLRPYQRTCTEVVAERCTGSGYGGCTSVNGPINIYYCQGENVSGNGCQQNDPLPGGVSWDSVNHRILGSFCGTVQVDQVGGVGSVNFCSSYDTTGCQQDEPTTPPTTPPTEAPIVSAQCQSITLYDNADWTIVGQAGNVTTIEDKMEAGDKLNFCVAGSTSAGAFDSARFTVNGVLQTVTTAKHPTLDQFCQIGYTIPAGVSHFEIGAQIHHSTLGWK